MSKVYFLYVVFIIFCGSLAQMAQVFSGKRKLNPFFWTLTTLLLILFMGLRKPGIGVDDFNYLRIFNTINQVDFFDYYSSASTEIGYYVLNRVIFLFHGDFQSLIFLTSIIIVVPFMYFIAHFCSDKTSIGLSVVIFITTQYFFYVGIIRLGIASAITAYGIVLFSKQKYKKSFFILFVACLFHYSAFICLPIAFILKLSFNNKKTVLLLFTVILISFLFLKFAIYPFVGDTKYEIYAVSAGGIGSIASSLPFLLLYIYKFNELRLLDKRNTLNYYMYICMVIMELLSGIVGFERIVWYFRISNSKLLPSIIRSEKSLFWKYIFLILVLLYCCVYCYTAYLGNSYRGTFLLQYSFFFN